MNPVVDNDIPTTLVVDVAGLPPQRARLARLAAWRRVLEGRSIELGELRESLVDAHGEVATLEQRLARAIADEAKGLLAALRAGASRALSTIGGSGRAGLEAKLAAARHRQAVAAAALVELDKEVAEVRGAIADIDGRIAEAATDALHEHAEATIGREYTEMLATLRRQLTTLEAIAQMTGSGHEGRLAAQLPAYKAAGHGLAFTPVAVGEPDLKDSIAAWWRLAAAWRDDPHADPTDHLVFAPLVDDPAAGVPYHALSEPERNFIDWRRAGLN